MSLTPYSALAGMAFLSTSIQSLFQQQHEKALMHGLASLAVSAAGYYLSKQEDASLYEPGLPDNKCWSILTKDNLHFYKSGCDIKGSISIAMNPTSSMIKPEEILKVRAFRAFPDPAQKFDLMCVATLERATIERLSRLILDRSEGPWVIGSYAHPRAWIQIKGQGHKG